MSKKINIMRLLQEMSRDVAGKEFYELDAETKRRLKEPMLTAIKGMINILVKEPDAQTRIFEEVKKEVEKM